MIPSPDLPFPALLELLASPSVSPFFPRILGVRMGRKILAFSVVFLAVDRKKQRKIGEVGFQGSNASGGHIVLLPGAFWAHDASKILRFLHLPPNPTCARSHMWGLSNIDRAE